MCIVLCVFSHNIKLNLYCKERKFMSLSMKVCESLGVCMHYNLVMNTCNRLFIIEALLNYWILNMSLSAHNTKIGRCEDLFQAL